MTLRILLLTFLLLQNCGAPVENQKEAAQVGGSILLERDILDQNSSGFPPASGIINQWLAEEILFKHASSSGFESVGSSMSLSETFKRRLAGQRYLRHLAEKNISVSKDEALDYYKNRDNEFKRSAPAAKIYHVLLKNKNEAEEVVRTLGSAGKKKEKSELFEKYSIHPLVVSSGKLIPELEKIVFSKNLNKQLHGPVKSRFGYHVLFILERYKNDSMVLFEEVYDEIYQRIFQQKLALKSLHILDSLISQTPYTIK